MDFHPDIMTKTDEIFSSVSQNSTSGNARLLSEAVNMVYPVYKDYPSKFGYTYLEYLLKISRIATNEIGLGEISIAALILKDTVLDKIIEPAVLKKKFPESVSDLIEGMRKTDEPDTGKVFAKHETDRTEQAKVKRRREMTYEKKLSLQSENFTKLLLVLAGDVRVILIKIATILFECRHIKSLSEPARIALSRESGYLYAPIAHKLGLYTIKTELEEISMKYNQPDIYKFIAKKLDEKKAERTSYIDNFIEPLKKELLSHGLDCEIKGRPKSISSIWNKMKKQNVDFEGVYDLFAIRIIIKNEFQDTKDEKEACWRVYSYITNIYTPNPNRLRDWISTPKSSGYESLHTTVLGENAKWVEVQIRTTRMDEIAEKGSAAHWKYKKVKSGGEGDNWLRDIREILESPTSDNIDASNQAKMDLYSDKVFVFTPKGELVTLPEKATVLDFAYSVHSHIGERCTGGKIGNSVQPLKYELNNGDRVEILTSKNQRPKKEWLDYCSSPRTKSRIKRTLKQEENEYASQGKEIIREALRKYNAELNDKLITRLMNHFGFKSFIEFFGAAGRKEIDVEPRIQQIFKPEITDDAQVLKQLKDTKEHDIEPYKEDYLVVDNQNKIDFQLAKCCNPIPGDSIFGFVTISKGTKIHKVNCPNANEMMSRFPYRIVAAKWRQTDRASIFPVRILITGYNNPGILGSIVDVISNELRLKMGNVNYTPTEGNVFEAHIMVFLQNTEHLDLLLSKIKNINGISTAEREYAM